MKGTLAGLFVTVLLMISPSTVSAGCDPHSPVNQNGHWHAYSLQSNYADIDGVASDLLEYRPFVPFEFVKTRASSAWVMLSRNGYNQFAQIGWYEWAVNYRKVFIQYWNGSGYPIIERNPHSDYTYTEYRVTYSSGYFFFYDNGYNALVVQAAFNPDKGEISSEITNLVNQMPGDYGSFPFMHFDNMRKRVSGSWSNFAPNVVNTSDNTKFYASNQRGGMDPQRELVTADKRGDCA